MPNTQISDWIFKAPLHGVRLLPDQEAGLVGFEFEHVLNVRLNFCKHLASATAAPLWRLQDQGERYKSVIELFDEPTRKLLQIECEGSGFFEYKGDAINIAWQNNGTGFEHYLQTVGLSLWLEINGVPCIHANAIATDEGVVGLIAPSQTGKTTLTAALAVRGMAMMTDDMMAIHKTTAGWKVYPAWPQLRMWPQVAEHFVTNAKVLQRVHHRFEKRLLKLNEQNTLKYTSKSGLLKRLYLLERWDTETAEIIIKPVTGAEALVALLQNSMLADAYRPLDIEADRLATLALLLETVDVKKIVYPSGKKHLAGVCKAIEADIHRRE